MHVTKGLRGMTTHVHVRYPKYNDLLRGFGAQLLGCKENKYITTTHVRLLFACAFAAGRT